MPRWSPRRADVLAATADEILHNYGRGRVIVAVDGPSGAVTDAFAADLVAALHDREHAAFGARVDDFLKPRADRAEAAPLDAYDDSALRRVLVEPFKLGGSTGFVPAFFDAARDVPFEPDWVTAPADAVLVIAGPLLLRPDVRGVWNMTIWLDTGSADAPVYPDDLRPRQLATAIVDLHDPEHPRRVFADSC
jgi:uridine kinase